MVVPQSIDPIVIALTSDVLIADAHGILAECYREVLDGHGVRLPDEHLGGVAPHVLIEKLLRAVYADPEPEELVALAERYRVAMRTRIAAGNVACVPTARPLIAMLQQCGWTVAFLHAGYDAADVLGALGIPRGTFATVVGVDVPTIAPARPVNPVTRIVKRIPRASAEATCGIVTAGHAARMCADAGAASVGIVTTTSAQVLSAAGTAINYRSLEHVTWQAIESAISANRRRQADARAPK